MADFTIQQTFDLAVQHHQAGRLQEAEQLYRQILAQQPEHADAMHLLGVLAHQAGHNDIAVDLIRRAIAFRPNYPEAHNNLGIALKDKGQVDEAITAYRQAIALRPNFPEAHSNLGIALTDKGQADEAIAACRQAIALSPDVPDAYTNLGNALREKGQLDEAAAAYRQAIALNPNLPEVHNNLGSALKSTGQLDEAIAAFRQAIALRPNYAEAHGNLVFALYYHPAYDARTIAEEHRLWNRRYAEPLGKFVQPYTNNRDPDRRLRIGYVSPDFKNHPVGQFLLPLLEQHDRRTLEVFCYSNSLRIDEITARLRSQADHWRNIAGLADQKAADLVRSDGIDILVDLAGHTSGNRLLLFARKPAPVQVSYLGYPGTTGLSAIDYRLTDRFADPEGLIDDLHSERLYRLPRTNWCFAAPQDAPPVEPPPALLQGYVIFGSFNNFAKVTEVTLRAWTEILRKVPGSRLLLKAPAFGAESARERLRRNFAAQGIEAGRLDLQNWQPDYASHLTLYGRMDIALDTFPYNGTTTTCDALWMGVPVITLAGQTHVSRVGLSLLSNIGLSETIATTTDEYISRAVALAQDLDRLKTLRLGLRERMRRSPLMDAEGFARDMEAAYRQMWGAWCETDSATT